MPKRSGGAGQSSKTALAVMGLQEQLPQARVLYASATGASEAKQLRYMTRLGCFGYESTSDFIGAIEKKGVGALEMYACGMKGSGAYLCRTLSYTGAEFNLLEIELTDAQRRQYDDACEYMMLFKTVSSSVGVGYDFEGKNDFGHPLYTDPDKSKKMCSMRGAIYWGAHQRLFRSLLMCAKVPDLARVANEAVTDGCSVVIGLQSTGEAGINRAVREAEEAGEELSELVSAPEAILSQLIKAHFPTCVQAADAGNPKLDRLLHHVHAAVTAWERQSAGGGGEGGADDSESDDDEVQMGEVKTVDEIEAEKLATAARTGQLIDLSEDIDIEAFEAGKEQRRREAVKRRKRDAVTASAASGADREEEDQDGLPPWKAAMLAARAHSGQAAGAPPARDVDSDSDGAGESKPQVGRKRRSGELEGGEMDSDSDSDIVFDPFAKGATVPSKPRDVKPSVGAAKGKGKGTAAKGRKAKKARPDSEDEQDELEDEGDDNVEDELGRLGLVRDDRLVEIKSLLLRGIEALNLPANPVDELIDLCGGSSEVAEMTGRKTRMVRQADDTFKPMQRADEAEGGLKLLNLTEREKFMEAEKTVAIISEAASSGISLHADVRYRSHTRRRVHLTLELPWSAQQAVQQFGRSHRSNQASAPVYRLAVTPCGGERRFASSAASRLQKMGAMLKGDRRALGAGVELEAFDVDNDEGKEALTDMLNSVCLGQCDQRTVKLPAAPRGTAHAPAADDDEENETGDGDGEDSKEAKTKRSVAFFEFARKSLLACELLDFRPAAMGQSGAIYSIKKVSSRSSGSGVTVAAFLNRLLGLPIAEQDALFAFFSAQLEALLEIKRAEGSLSSGVQMIHGMSVKVPAPFPLPLHTDMNGGARTFLTRVVSDRGMSFAEAQRQLKLHNTVAQKRGLGTDANGFYLTRSLFGKQKKQRVTLALELPRKWAGNGPRHYRRHTPAIMGGADASSKYKLDDLLGSSEPVRTEEGLAKAERLWDYWFEQAGCEYKHSHPNWKASAKTKKKSPFPLRFKETYMVSGAVLPLFKMLEETVLSIPNHELNDEDFEGAEGQRRLSLEPRPAHDDQSWVVAGEDGQMHGYGASAAAAEKAEHRAKGKDKGLTMCLAITTDTRRRFNGVYLPKAALPQVASLVDHLGGLTAEASDAIEAAFGKSKSLWGVMGILSPKEFKQQAAKEAEARRAKQEERAQRSRAKKDTFDDGIFTDEY